MVVKHSHHFLQTLFAIFVGYLLLTRLFISWVQYAPDSFVSTAEWVSSSQISFEDIDVQQDWLGFQFQIQDLEIKHADYEIQIHGVDADINVFSPLVPTMKFGHYLEIEQGSYHSKKAPAESVDVDISGIDVNQLTQINLDISQLWKRVKVSDLTFNNLLGSGVTFRIYDYQSLKGAQLSVVSEFGLAYQNSLNFERFSFKSTFNPTIWGGIDQGELSVSSFQPLRVEAVAQFLPSVWHEILPTGELIIDLNAEVSDSHISKLVLNLSSQSLKWSQANQTLPKNIGLELVWESHLQNIKTHFKDWRFRLSKIQLDNKYIEAVSPIELNFEENQLLRFSSQHFDIEPFKVIVKSLVPNPHISALFDQTSDFSTEGLSGQFNWQTFELPDLQLTIKKMSIPVTAYPGLEIQNLNISKNSQEMVFQTNHPVLLMEPRVHKQAMKIDLPNSITVQHSLKEGRWALDELQFEIDNRPIVLSAKGNFDGYIDANLSADIGKMSTLKQYLPYEFLSTDLQDWLKMALIDGRNIKASAQLQGDLKDFPFTEGEGLFKVKATLDKAYLKFSPDWPRLENFSSQIEFTPYQLKITSPKVYLGAKTHAREVVVLIDDIDQEDVALKIKGQVDTQFEHAMEYLSISPLAKSLSMDAFIDNTTFSGPVSLGLSQVWVPISGYEKQTEKVSGMVHFKKSAMTIFGKIPIESILGSLAFTEKGVKGPKLIANVFKNPSLFRINTAQKTEMISIKGSGFFLEDKNPFFASALPWNLDIKVPMNAESQTNDDTENSASVETRLIIDLSKTKSLLPAPLDQTALKGKVVSLTALLAKESMDVQADIAHLLSFKGRWKHVDNQFQAQRIRLLLGGDSKKALSQEILKKQGLDSYIKGGLPELDLDAWITQANDLPIHDLWSDETSLSLDWTPSLIEIKSLRFLNSNYPDVSIEWLKRNLKTVLQVRSPDVLANAVIKAESPVEMNIERLKLYTVDSVESQASLEIESAACHSESKQGVLWPDIQFKGKNIVIDDYLIEMLDFYLTDSADHLAISNLSGAFGHKAGQMIGQYWFGKAHNKSKLSLSLNSNNVAEVTRFLQLKEGFTGNKANVETRLEWVGGVECFSKKEITGQLDFVLEDGSIENIEPGFARLIGLLSVEALARRLQLNMKDVTNKGMVYDQIKGHANFKLGQLHLDSFKLKAPSASAELFGQVDLLKEEFNLKANVTPAIGASMPTIAALAGYSNPLAALAVYTVMKVLPGINENLVTYQYDITGPWLEPNITDVNKPSNDESYGFEKEESILDAQ